MTTDERQVHVWNILTDKDRETLGIWFRGGTVSLVHLDDALDRLTMALREAEGREEEHG